MYVTKKKKTIVIYEFITYNTYSLKIKCFYIWKYNMFFEFGKNLASNMFKVIFSNTLHNEL